MLEVIEVMLEVAVIMFVAAALIIIGSAGLVKCAILVFTWAVR